ncbi:hypothetical protein [Selenihalanaerobacter shriftii]|uniref:Uncharacterized protein n=1 Tax=Selenihalanaerobacter shriftii TaxID=142842 RepID=A0A1T4PVZ3_9FIRM|nr:hypothetical protein [Selenihalanaerobacter shriftii]SJZ95108.1 hypothetical protein SAMN02745118_02320 [Selenihalanaerobacter shriftii]
MNKKSTRLITVLVLLSVMILGTSSAFAAYLPLKTDVSKQQARIDAYKEINQLRHEEDIDFNKIEKIYNDVLQNTVQARDKEFSETMDQYIQAAFYGVRNGQDPALAAQIVDKTLKKAFYLTVKHELDEAVEEFSNKEEAHHKIDEAIVYYEAIAGTAKKRSEDLHEGILSGLKSARRAIENDSLIDLKVADQIIGKTIIKVFHASVLHEAEEVEEYLAENPDKAKIKQMEGLVYYQTIKGIVKSNNKIGNIMVEDMLSGDINEVDYDVILEELNRGFVGKPLHYLEEVKENWGTDKALVEAWEALVYYNVIVDDVETRLGTKTGEELLTNLRTYVDAVQQGNRAKVDILEEKIKITFREYISKI